MWVRGQAPPSRLSARSCSSTVQPGGTDGEDGRLRPLERENLLGNVLSLRLSSARAFSKILELCSSGMIRTIVSEHVEPSARLEEP